MNYDALKMASQASQRRCCEACEGPSQASQWRCCEACEGPESKELQIVRGGPSQASQRLFKNRPS